ncbi:hypothetical protein FRC04_000111 [Tulasnella sp. 424]|nr:hypothetical protein FRC04_000111 [Tulasnella sp. 424]KAG8981974.1 hypothetical protein FRC05_000116 [Tulasnella sp. 425]
MSTTPIIFTTAPTKTEIPAVSIPTLVISAPLSPPPQSPHSLRSFFGPRGRARSILQFIHPEGPTPAKRAQPDSQVAKLEEALKEMDTTNHATNGTSQPPSLAKNFVRKHRRNQSSISISSNSSDGEGSAPAVGLHPSFKPSSRFNRNSTPVVISLDI